MKSCRSESEVMTAMEMNMKERFSATELTALRNDLLQGGLIDFREAAELVQVFLMGRGYGVSPEAATRPTFQVRRKPAFSFLNPLESEKLRSDR